MTTRFSRLRNLSGARAALWSFVAVEVLSIPLFVFFNLCSGLSFAQYSLSPRLGEIIDQDERRYFNLFPTVEKFTSAKASIRADHHVDITITRPSEHDTTFTISETLAENLAIFIEGFESVRSKKSAVSWEILGGLAWSGAALESKSTKGNGAKIITRNGETFHGKLLYANDSLVVLWQSSDDFNWRTLEYSAKIIHFSDIEIITIERDSKFWTGFAIGAPIGGLTLAGLAAALSAALSGNVHADFVAYALLVGGAGAGLLGGLTAAVLSNDIERELHGSYDKYRELLPDITERSVFSAYPPPEVQRLIASTPPVDINALPLPFALKHESSIHTILFAECASSLSALNFSANYERPLSSSFWLRLGLGYGSDKDNYGSQTAGNGWGPLAMALYLSGGTSKLEFGLGASLITSTEKRYEYSSYGVYDTKIYNHGWELHPAITLGYRYQPDEGGLVFRIGANYTYYSGYPVEVSLGYAF